MKYPLLLTNIATHRPMSSKLQISPDRHLSTIKKILKKLKETQKKRLKQLILIKVIIFPLKILKKRLKQLKRNA
jgi:hypothetical protein